MTEYHYEHIIILGVHVNMLKDLQTREIGVLYFDAKVSWEISGQGDDQRTS
jgi:hypothetical protein